MPMDLDLRMVTADMRSRVPRVFLLVRHVDVSGVTGTGIVAEGTEWTDGSVSLRWRSEHASTTFYEAGVRAVLAVHGHRGASEVVYLSPSDGLVPVGSSFDLVPASQRAAYRTLHLRLPAVPTGPRKARVTPTSLRARR
ncbi:hypothetical protein ACIBG5_10675 [Kribbella sp. NPDC050241]|uniref:hypothetical protein n=1 Tax=Kribbella sp. NPDC050241 TaxID=3364115 RepID=UPI0037BC599B